LYLLPTNVLPGKPLRI